ncbi:MAG: L,D-transpeptidase family protein [Desulfurivibrionaceae bacterium]
MPIMSLLYGGGRKRREVIKLAGGLFFCLFLAHLVLPDYSRSREWHLNGDRQHPSVLGKVTSSVIDDDEETLPELAQRHGLGYNEITLANPDVDPWYPGEHTRISIPGSWIMPRASYTVRHDPGIIINLGELRLYFLDQGEHEDVVTTFPVGIGRQGSETDTGRYWVTVRKENPTWTIPSSLRDEYPEGLREVPPGPANPLGDYALRLSRNDYMIHGTNNPLGIGRRVSHGCIRMYPEDIEKLYNLTPVDCEVLIVYETVKVGSKDGTPFIEVHPDYLNDSDQHKVARHLLVQQGLWKKCDLVLLHQAVEEKKGVPVSLQ